MSSASLPKKPQKTIFFDRDGTLIIDKVYLNDPNQIEYLPGAFECLQRLRDEGYQFIVVTNQSGIARGLVTLENLHEIHRRMTAEFGKHGISFAGYYYAPYSVESNHPMRKPNPGMLLSSGEEHQADLAQSWMIGDRGTDVVAGQRAGTRTILLEGIESEQAIAQLDPTFVARDLFAATEFILQADAAQNRSAVSR